jgi:hypothetical protein
MGNSMMNAHIDEPEDITPDLALQIATSKDALEGGKNLTLWV